MWVENPPPPHAGGRPTYQAPRAGTASLQAAKQGRTSIVARSEFSPGNGSAVEVGAEVPPFGVEGVDPNEVIHRIH